MKQSTIQKLKFYLLKIFISTFAIIFAAWICQKGIHIAEPRLLTGLIVALVLLLVNMFLRPIMIMFTIPFTIGTFGLFILIINAITIEIVAFLVDKFTIDSFGWALIFSLLVSLATTIIESVGKTKIIRINSEQTEDNSNNNDTDFSDYEEV